MSAKTLKLQSGDIIAIPLDKNLFAGALVLHVSQIFKGCMMVGFYDKLFTTIASTNSALSGSSFIDTPNYVHTYPVKKGYWLRVGANVDALQNIVMPELIVGFELYRLDAPVRKVSIEEMKEYRDLTVMGQVFVENMLKDYFHNRT